MKVLIVLTYYYPYWSGLSQYAKRIAEGFKGDGIEVEVACVKHEANLDKQEIINGVRVNRVPVWFRMSRSFIAPGIFSLIKSKIQSADRIVVFLPYAEVLWVMAWAKIWHKKVYLVHNGDLMLPPGRLNKLVENIYIKFTKWAIGWSEKVIIQTTDFAENSQVLKNYGHKWKVIVPPFEKPVIKTQKVNYFNSGEGNGRVVVGFAGRFVYEKGVDILLKAILEVVKVYPQAKFLFAGETNMKYENFFDKQKGLIEKTARYVVWLGKLKHEDMASFYRACKVFVIPSRNDCFPFTQAEAMLAGTPVVTTNIPGARWLIGQTGMGKMVEVNSPTALAAGIVEVIKRRDNYALERKRVNKILNSQQAIKSFRDLILEHQSA